MVARPKDGGARKDLAHLNQQAYMHINSGADGLFPDAPPGKIDGPRARFFVFG